MLGLLREASRACSHHVRSSSQSGLALILQSPSPPYNVVRRHRNRARQQKWTSRVQPREEALMGCPRPHYGGRGGYPSRARESTKSRRSTVIFTSPNPKLPHPTNESSTSRSATYVCISAPTPPLPASPPPLCALLPCKLLSNTVAFGAACLC